MFAQKKVTLPPNMHKIIILDEVDSMTTGAQQALRRTMELYSATTRFALACNLSSKIIEPIQSRCAILRYSKLTDAELLKRILEICEAENVKYTPEGLEAIIFTADGDMRQAVNNLESTFSGFSMITPTNVFKVCDQPHPTLIQDIVSLCLSATPQPALSGLEQVYALGYSSVDIITTFFKVVKAFDMPEPKKLDFIKEVGMTHMRLLEGTDSLLQLSGLVVRLCQIK
jgi:replication factor C subunit 2/4